MIVAVDEILDIVGSPGKPPLVTITGPAGVGRTTLLARLREALAQRRIRTVTTQFAPTAAGVPAGLALRPGGSQERRLRPHTETLPSPDSPAPSWSPLGPVAGAATDPGAARWGAAAAAAPLLVTGNAVLLLDDVQWIDADTLAVLEALVRRITGTTVTCVCAIRTPTSGILRTEGLAALRRLRADGLVHEVRLNPMGRTEIARTVRETTQAAPEDALVDRLAALTRGLPAALHDVIDVMRRDDVLRVVSRHAYFVPGADPVALPPDHQLLRVIRVLGAETWAVARAMAVLHPLGEVAAGLVADALEVPAEEVRERLAALCAEGVLHHNRRDGGWRFTVPVVAATLAATLGPFERRTLAEKAVTALWSGEARSADPDYLTDQLAVAGRLVDPARAYSELLARAAAVLPDNPELSHRVSRWLRAAGELAGDRAQRVITQLMYASSCYVRGDYASSLEGAQPLLRDLRDQLPPEVAQEVQVMAVCALHSVGRTAELEELAAGRLSWSDDPAPRTVTRAVALCMLDRWNEAGALLGGTRNLWQANEASACLGGLFEVLSRLWAGDPEPLRDALANRERWPMRHVERHRLQQVNAYVTTLLLLGELRQAEQLLADEGVDTALLHLSDQSLLACLRGEAEAALDFARRSYAVSTARGYDAGRAGTQQAAAELLLSRGRLTGAQELLAVARNQRPVLGHLLDGAEARILRVLGRTEEAAAKLTAARAAAAGRGLLIGADEITLQLGELALERGDTADALQQLTELERIAEALRTGRAELHVLLLRAMIKQDPSAGAACLALARDRGQPAELSFVIDRLVRHGAASPKLLPEAYRLLGDLDALLYRAWLRNVMREHDVAVPGRQVTVAENERLLAVLVAEGLGNKQLALVLRTSDKSVEGRLSRLFARTGLRSRIELAAALLSGEYPG